MLEWAVATILVVLIVSFISLERALSNIRDTQKAALGALVAIEHRLDQIRESDFAIEQHTKRAVREKYAQDDADDYDGY